MTHALRTNFGIGDKINVIFILMTLCYSNLAYALIQAKEKFNSLLNTNPELSCRNKVGEFCCNQEKFHLLCHCLNNLGVLQPLQSLHSPWKGK